MSAAKRIDEVIAGGLSAALKAEGYRKTARTFRARTCDAIRIVNVQASQWNFGETGKLTLNLAVYFPEIASRLEIAILERPKEYESHLRARIGSLMPDGRDHWWAIEERTDVLSLAAEVAQVYLDCGKPWLDRVAQLAAFVEVVKERQPLEAAAAAMILGDGERARALLFRACTSTASGHLRASARRCVERWHLD